MKPASEASDMSDGFAVAATAVIDADAAPSQVVRDMPSRATDFYELTKPRMNFLVVITTMVGYFMAARGEAHWPLLLHTLIGTALTAAGASVLNQLIERDYDKL